MPMETERISEGGFLPSWVRFQHVARYRYAAEHVAGKRVVDGACGSGYGSAMLADANAADVLGLDIADEGLREAQGSHRRANLAFRRCDLATLDLEPASRDVFISFETIEHVTDECAFLAGIRRTLADDGLFLCSTPNRRMTNPGTAIDDKPYNPYHVREYDRDEFEASLRAHFTHVEVLGQSFWSRRYERALRGLARAHPLVPVRSHQMRKVLHAVRDRYDNHLPQPIDGTREPEALFAFCRP